LIGFALEFMSFAWQAGGVRCLGLNELYCFLAILLKLYNILETCSVFASSFLSSLVTTAWFHMLGLD
jgi:hypothetical protein